MNVPGSIQLFLLVTLKGRSRNSNRRFTREPAWVPFMCDLIEKPDIQSANRRVVSSNRRLTRAGVSLHGRYNNNCFSYHKK